MKFKKWVLCLFSTILLIFLFVILFNYVVDPYRIYNTNIFKNKPKEDLQSRFTKVLKIQEIKPASVFLGNSRPQMAFNSAFGGSNLGEAKSYLRWAIKQGNLKQALLVFDDKSMVGAESKVNDFVGYFDNPSRYKILFSYQTFYDSTATIRKQKQVPLFEPNGQRTEASLLEQVRKSGSYYEHSLKVEREHMASYKKWIF